MLSSLFLFRLARFCPASLWLSSHFSSHTRRTMHPAVPLIAVRKGRTVFSCTLVPISFFCLASLGIHGMEIQWRRFPTLT